MRLRADRFSVPDWITDEPMPDKAFRLLVFLFKVSDFAGRCNPGYDAMRRAMRARDGEKGSNHTVNKYLAWLKKDGWIFALRKTNGRMVVSIQIPPRFRRSKPPLALVSVVHS